MLSDEFKTVIDYYCAAEKKRGKKGTTIYGESSNASTFLYALQEKGNQYTSSEHRSAYVRYRWYDTVFH